jgi:hypothetical protein
MTVQEFLDDLQKIEVLAQSGLSTAKALNPELASPITAVQVVFPFVSEIIAVALNSWSKANGQLITPETIQALLPNQTPLTPPDAA